MSDRLRPLGAFHDAEENGQKVPKLARLGGVTSTSPDAADPPGGDR
jgi:hypothetical protein